MIWFEEPEALIPSGFANKCVMGQYEACLYCVLNETLVVYIRFDIFGFAIRAQELTSRLNFVFLFYSIDYVVGSVLHVL